MRNSNCPECDSAKIEDGHIEGASITLTRSSTLKKVFKAGGLVHCRICLSCGALFNLRGDPEELAKMLE